MWIRDSKEEPMPHPLVNIIARGYFPKELPPPFRTTLFAAFCESAPAAAMKLELTKATLKNNRVTKPAVHNLARAGTLRRKLSLPNPISQYQVASVVVDHWLEIKKKCKQSAISLTTPKYSKFASRSISPAGDFDTIPLARAKSRAGARYLLTADVSQFYPSIYTHSIAWALHSKAVAKTQSSNYKLLGNVLDLALRNGQDKQTIGIPIGPDTSLVVAEILASAIDQRLQGAIARRGYRYIDDISCGFRTVAEAEAALGQLQHLVSEHQLQLNPRKTKITELPGALEARWVPHLRLFKIRGLKPSAQQTDIFAFFGRAFELATEAREEAILRYAIRRMRSVNVLERNWTLYQSLLLQCVSVEPGTTATVIQELYRYHLLMPLDKVAISECLECLIEEHAPLHHGSEVVWAIWGAIVLGCHLSSTAIEKALEMPDSCVALCALHAINVGAVVGPVNLTGLQAMMHGPELFDERWLLAYEANIKGWLPNVGGVDFVAADKYFGPMKLAGVSFYEMGAKLPVDPKQPIDVDTDVESLLVSLASG